MVKFVDPVNRFATIHPYGEKDCIKCRDTRYPTREQLGIITEEVEQL